MDYKEFGEKVATVISELRRTVTGEVLVVHHDDADGLCSAAITKAALEREGYNVRTFCLEKVYPEVVEDLHGGSGRTIFYVDIGSSHADFISKCNASRNLVVILDHHDPKPADDPKVFDLNLEHYGFRGETDFSGSTCCYLFARALNERNRDLSYLALVGSCEIPTGFKGLNQVVLNEALKDGVVQPKGKTFEIVKLGVRVDRLFSKLQVLGAVGYYEGGPELGIRACLESVTDEVNKRVEELEARRKKINKRLLARLYRERLRETRHIQWFDAGKMYLGMGTKVIGQFCSFLSYQLRLVKPNKYILGFVDVPTEIPGWGKLKEELTKASVRTPKAMRPLIDKGELPGAVDLLTQASEGFGVADGHQFAASVVLPVNKKMELIENAERLVS